MPYTQAEATESAKELTKDQRSALLYVETCVVDYGGLLEGRRMNTEDHESLRQMQAIGWLTWGRIPSSLLGRHDFTHSTPNHWARLTASGWKVAHACRMIRAEQVGPYARSVFEEVDSRASEAAETRTEPEAQAEPMTTVSLTRWELDKARWMAFSNTATYLGYYGNEGLRAHEVDELNRWSDLNAKLKGDPKPDPLPYIGTRAEKARR